MLNNKKPSKKACYEELERIARVVCEQKIDQEEIPMFRSRFQGVLDHLARIHKEERERADTKKSNRKNDRGFRYKFNSNSFRTKCRQG